MPDSH